MTTFAEKRSCLSTGTPVGQAIEMLQEAHFEGGAAAVEKMRQQHHWTDQDMRDLCGDGYKPPARES